MCVCVSVRLSSLLFWQINVFIALKTLLTVLCVEFHQSKYTVCSANFRVVRCFKISAFYLTISFH